MRLVIFGRLLNRPDRGKVTAKYRVSAVRRNLKEAGGKHLV